VVVDSAPVPLFIRLGNRGRPFDGKEEITRVGSAKNIVISNIMAKKAEKYGCSITGIPGYPVENVMINNIRMEFEGGGTGKEKHNEVPEKEADYPEATMFGILPSYGFYIRHAKNIRFTNVDLHTSTSDMRPPFILDDVEKGVFEGISADANDDRFTITKCRDIMIDSQKKC
jgi:hypothetical protein